MDKKLKISVHQLVDFLLRTGDIDNRINNKSTMAEGSRIHAFYQSKQGHSYIAEYPLKETFQIDDFEITLEGRADGLIVKDDEYTIDEIKSTIVDLEEYFESQKEWHLGQAKCYAFMLANERDLKKVNIDLTYIHQLYDAKMTKSFTFTYAELKKDIYTYLKQYLKFYKLIYNKNLERNASATSLVFPFINFRKGQRELAKYSYAIAKNGGVLYSEAPTGIGKTISTLFPFAKSFSDGQNDRIFYLTAKNSGKESAFEAIKLLLNSGLNASAILITAKDKICFCPGKACNPDECPYAKGYYTKIKSILTDAIKKYSLFTPAQILRIASRNVICPFELSLDISLYVDFVVCDYNYFFDPQVYLKRFFDEAQLNSLVLIDEAHNLVERGRSMYSASIDSRLFKFAKRATKQLDHKKIHNAEKRITKLFNEFTDLTEGTTIINEISRTSLNGIQAYLLAATDVNKHHHSVVDDDFNQFFLELNKFSKLYDYYDETFALYVTKTGNKDTKISLYCLDPSRYLNESIRAVKGTVIFSATLSPSEYYMKMITGSTDYPMLALPSPFSKENFKLIVAPKLSIKYKDRQSSVGEVAKYILTIVNSKKGNYFIYAPSYEYLESLLPYLVNREFELLVQEKEMNDDEKKDFLSRFSKSPKKTTVGLAVVGGAFSEGIDLVADRLIGVAVIGVGLPQICFERELIKNYYSNLKESGFNYAYLYPGMNKVMQAVGRVIRSESDKGIALLIDERFLSSQYRDLFKKEWDHYDVVTSNEDLENEIKNFWLKDK